MLCILESNLSDPEGINHYKTRSGRVKFREKKMMCSDMEWHIITKRAPDRASKVQYYCQYTIISTSSHRSRSSMINLTPYQKANA